jgi:hypothetical protein
MFFKSKSKKEVAPAAKVEKLSKDSLSSVIGGSGGDVTPTPDPTPDPSDTKHIANIKWSS